MPPGCCFPYLPPISIPGTCGLKEVDHTGTASSRTRAERHLSDVDVIDHREDEVNVLSLAWGGASRLRLTTKGELFRRSIKVSFEGRPRKCSAQYRPRIANVRLTAPRPPVGRKVCKSVAHCESPFLDICGRYVSTEFGPVLFGCWNIEPVDNDACSTSAAPGAPPSGQIPFAVKLRKSDYRCARDSSCLEHSCPTKRLDESH